MSSRDDVDSVKSRTDILQVVAPYVALKRTGRVWKGLCPFHNEKTPSFQVNPDLGRWQCFGQCSEGGDAIKFLQKIDNLTFPEALERLALNAGVILSRDDGAGKERVQIGERDRLYAAVASTVKYYRGSLQNVPKAAEYLKRRGITDETTEQYDIGFAGGDWDSLPRHLVQAGISIDDAVRAGILALSDRGGHYDKLRGRIVFPIIDVQNRPIAFGGRLMSAEEGRPKYLNSAETPLFSKSKTLYGLSRARKAIADAGETIIVEGYLDVITCHQAGFLNVIATLGTSLTEDHAAIIGRHARRVLLAFDSDTAGIKAAQRANTIFETQEMEVLVLDMPAGEDPDSLISSGKSDEFRRAIVECLPIAEYRLRQILAHAGGSLTEREKTTLYQRDILPILRSTKSVVERERYVQMCAPFHPFYATGSAIAEQQIRQDADGNRPWQPSPRARETRYESGSGDRRDFGRSTRRQSGSRESVIRVVSGVETAELIIIQALLDPDQAFVHVLADHVKPAIFVRSNFYRLASLLLEQPITKGVQAALDDAELQKDIAITELLFGGQDVVPGITEEVVQDSLDLLVRHSEEQMLAKLRQLSREGNLQANELYTKIMRQRKGTRPEHKLNA
jgi:DNA primase